VLVGAPSWAATASQSSPLRMAAEQAERATPLNAKEARQAAMASGEPYKSLVILVNFQDVKFVTPNPTETFYNLLNQEGYSYNGSTGSAADYYHYNSNGRFDPEFDVVGPVTVSERLSTYSADPWQMIEEAVRLADAEVDFSAYADGSEARGVYVFYAGIADSSTSIWPHRSAISPVRLDGVNVSNYACSAEHDTADKSALANIGTFCHEFGHVIGLPDFYDTDYEQNGEAPAMSIYSLMDTGCYNNGTRTPPSLTGMERWMLGWLAPKEFEVSKEYTIKPVSEDEAYIINTDNDGEYFIVETRSDADANGTNVWDANLADELGISMPIMMVYHADRSSNTVSGRPAASLWNSNQINCFSTHECFKVVKAGADSDKSPWEWSYPGYGTTSLSSASNSDFRAWGNKSLIEEFSNISASGNNITVDVFNGTEPAKFLTLVEAGENWAEFEWGTATQAGPFTVELYDNDNALLQKLETTEKRAFVTMLKAATIYKLKLSADGGLADELQFKTAIRTSNIPHLPLKGSYAAGESVILSISGITEDVVSAVWTMDGTVVDTSTITPAAGKHTIKATVKLSDGNEEIYTKTITVK
jgi:M6 family metalloprotease-like protein